MIQFVWHSKNGKTMETMKITVDARCLRVGWRKGDE